MTRARAGVLVLALVATALYLPNFGDYFLGDDFDLIRSFYGKPLRYQVELFWSNESGDVWKTWGIDPALGRGYLRPLKIWLLSTDFALWGTNALGFHLTSTLLFVGNVLFVHAILRRVLPERPYLACAGGVAVATHPAFAEVVPFITAREELLATFFGLASFHAFLGARLLGRGASGFHLFFALALLSKESALGFLTLPLGWDLAHGRVDPRSPAALRALARFYAPTAALIAVYFALRLVAFGNFVGGEGGSTHYLSAPALLRFHAFFWSSLADPTLLSVGGSPPAVAAVAAGFAVLAALAGSRLGRLAPERRRDLLLFGPLWYMGSTAILHGVYFDVRHNLLPVIGLLLFATLALAALLETGLLRREAPAAALFALVAALLFLPPTVATSREYSAAAAAVEEIRARIEERTLDLPDGAIVSISGVPQWSIAPFFFGWGLLSALQRPFTESDLAARATVFNARNLAMNQVRAKPPESFDRVIELDPREWVTPALEARQAKRAWRNKGIALRGRLYVP